MFVQRRRRAPGWHAAVHDYSRTPASTRSADKPWRELPYTPVYIPGEANRKVPVFEFQGRSRSLRRRTGCHHRYAFAESRVRILPYLTATLLTEGACWGQQCDSKLSWKDPLPRPGERPIATKTSRAKYWHETDSYNG